MKHSPLGCLFEEAKEALSGVASLIHICICKYI